MRSTLAAIGGMIAALVACGEQPSNSPPAPEGRVNAVMATGKNASFADLCDLAPEPAKAFAWPELTAAPPQPTTARYRWVNVWATWCKPCIEELPLLTRTFREWKTQGHDVELTLLSVDADAEAAKKFIAERPGTPASLQLKDATTATDWLTSVGLASGGAIPVHTVLDPQGALVCARQGGVTQPHLDRFKQVLFP